LGWGSEVHHIFWLDRSLAKRLDDPRKRPCPHVGLLPRPLPALLVPVHFRIFSSNRVKIVLVGACLVTGAQQGRNGTPFCVDDDAKESSAQSLASDCGRRFRRRLFLGVPFALSAAFTSARLYRVSLCVRKVIARCAMRKLEGHLGPGRVFT